MDNDLKQRWLDALRNGTYQQGQSRLRTQAGRYCCLGVLCDISGKGEWRKRGAEWYYEVGDDSDFAYPPPAIADSIIDDAENGLFDKLTSMNDSGVPFTEIATYIEKAL
jgi:hypothetical protein